MSPDPNVVCTFVFGSKASGSARGKGTTMACGAGEGGGMICRCILKNVCAENIPCENVYKRQHYITLSKSLQRAEMRSLSFVVIGEHYRIERV